MICMARTFGAPDSVPAGKVARRTSIGPLPSARQPGHLRCEVHDVAVALDGEELVDVLASRIAPPDPRHCGPGRPA